MAGYEEKVQIPPMTFGGLNTRKRDVFAEIDFASTARNCDFRPQGSVRKRTGLASMGVGDTVYSPYGEGAGDFIGALVKQSAGEKYMLAIRGGVPNLNEFSTGEFDKIELLFTAGQTYRSVHAPFSELDPHITEYLGECLYVTNGTDEPHIMTGVANDQFRESITIDTVAGVGSGDPVIVEIDSPVTYDGDSEGDWVKISGTSGAVGGRIDDNPWRVEWLTSTTFYLCNPDGSRWLAEGVLSVGYNGTAEFFPTALHRWPKANWSTTESEQFTGYPDRWEDPNADGGATWPAGDVTDFPRGIEYIGEGQSARLFAYGFELDPDRIDYSALGIPWHIGKVSFQDATTPANEAADEAAAVSNPGLDGGFFYCNRGDGDLVIGVREFSGYIVVFKRRKIFIYSGIPGSSTFENLGLVRVINSGAVSDNSIFAYGNDLLFWSLDGPRSLGTTDRYGDLVHGSLCFEIQEAIDETTPANRDKIHGFWDRENERVMWFAPGEGATVPDRAFAMYPAMTEVEQRRWSVWDGRYTENNSVAKFGDTLNEEESAYQINLDGDVYLMNTGLFDSRSTQGLYSIAYDNTTGPFDPAEILGYSGGLVGITSMTHSSGLNEGTAVVILISGDLPTDGQELTGATSGETADMVGGASVEWTDEAIEFEYISNWRPYGGGVEFAKRALYLTIVFGDNGRGTLSIEHGADFDGSWTEASDAVVIRGSEGAYWGSALWDGFIWNDTGKALIRYALTGISRLRRFRFYDDSTQGVDIIGASLDVHMKGGRG